MKKARTLGLVAVMALALTAFVGVASASASGFVGDKYPSYLKGTGTGTAVLTLASGVEIKCTPPVLTATAGGGSETLTADIADSTCGASEPLKANGCKFTLRPGAEASGHFDGTFDIGPAGCGPISTTFSGCKIEVGAQSGLTATFTNQNAGSTAQVNIAASTSIKYSVQPNCGISAGEAVGKFSAEWVLKNYKDSGHTTQQGVRVVKNSPVGIYLAGEKSGEAAKQPKLSAEKYPVTIAGKQGESSNMVMFRTSLGAPVKCTNGLFSGVASGATAAQSLSASFTGCVYSGGVATVTMNSCSYELGVANAGPPYSGSVSLSCGKAGDAVKIDVPLAGCSISIPAQTIAAATYENLGTGSGRQVLVTLAGSGISYSTSGGGSCGSSSSGGSLSGTITLSGSNVE